MENLEFHLPFYKVGKQFQRQERRYQKQRTYFQDHQSNATLQNRLSHKLPNSYIPCCRAYPAKLCHPFQTSTPSPYQTAPLSSPATADWTLVPQGCARYDPTDSTEKTEAGAGHLSRWPYRGNEAYEDDNTEKVRRMTLKVDVGVGVSVGIVVGREAIGAEDRIRRGDPGTSGQRNSEGRARRMILRNWEIGRMIDWKIGRLEGWKVDHI